MKKLCQAASAGVNRRRILISFAYVLILACDSSLAPTPESPLVRVETGVETVSLARFEPAVITFNVPVKVTNTSERAIYFNKWCFFSTQKAVDGDWVQAFGQNCADIGVKGTPIAAGATTSLEVVVAESAMNPSDPLIAHAAGLYRIRILLFFDPDYLQPLPSDAGYSRPFQVIE
jgi:hypothetical protein